VEEDEDIPEDEPTPEEDAEGDDQGGDALDTDEHDEL